MDGRRTLLVLAAAAGLVVAPAATASAAPPVTGGCHAFGAHVAGLATSLGPVFGATASGVASSGPQAFPTNVEDPEQAFCCG